MNYVPFNKNSIIDNMLTNLENIRVMICFEDYSLIGQTYYRTEQRFLDTLNEGLVMGKQRITEFLIVTQALITSPTGEKEQITDPCFVNKDSILFVGTFNETKSTTSQKANIVKTYPWIEKDAFSAKLYFAGKYRLTGEIHGNPNVLPVRYIESRKRFFPMTNAKLVSLLQRSEISFDLVAVNRNSVSLFEVLETENDFQGL